LRTADYGKDALVLAPELLGKLICRNMNGTIIRGRISETEAYCGEKDTACHASKGKTERTKIMYNAGGFAYIYLCYGIHWMLNVVTGREDYPEAVLIRGIEDFPGPGRLTKYLGIDKTLNGENLAKSDKLWIEDDGCRCTFRAAKRIGIDYATEKYKNKLWRFVKSESKL
jgi:DNA-3-methyladenine glycosylase